MWILKFNQDLLVDENSTINKNLIVNLLIVSKKCKIQNYFKLVVHKKCTGHIMKDNFSRVLNFHCNNNNRI